MSLETAGLPGGAAHSASLVISDVCIRHSIGHLIHGPPFSALRGVSANV